MCKNLISLNLENRFFLYSGFYTRRTVEHKKDLSVLLCIQGESVTKSSTKLNQQNESFCESREKLLISGDRYSIEPERHQINTGFSLAVFLHKSLASMLAERVSSKFHIFLYSFTFWPNIHFQTDSHPLKGVYLLNSLNSGRVKSNTKQFYKQLTRFRTFLGFRSCHTQPPTGKIKNGHARKSSPCAVTPLSSYYITLTSA